MIDFQIHPFSLKVRAPFQSKKGILLYGKMLDGKENLAEVSPLPGFSSETLEEALHQLESVKSKLLKGNLECFKKKSLFPSVAFGLESLFFTPPKNRSYPLCGFLNGSFEEMQSEIPFLLREGYQHIKIKIAHLSFKEAHSIIESLLGKAKLKIDLNRSWDIKKSLSFFQHYPIDAFEYIEEPVSDIKDLSLFPYPIALDETLREPSFPFLANIKALIVKPMMVGSLQSIKEIVTLSHQLNAQVILSSSYESGVGLFHLCSLLEKANIPLHPLGVDTHRLIENDILKTPHFISKGVLHLSPLKVPYVSNLVL